LARQEFRPKLMGFQNGSTVLRRQKNSWKGVCLMSIRLVILPQHGDTQFVPLAVLGYCLTRTRFFAPLHEVRVCRKALQHQSYEKLLDIIVSILANCSSVRQIDLRIRPDLVLAEAWSRAQFAQQSTLADTLDAFTADSISQLRCASQTLFLQQAMTAHHNFEDALLLDIELTGLPASRYAQGSEKGYFSQRKNSYGRQVARVSAPLYHETLLSLLYPGSQSGLKTFKSTMRATHALLTLTREQRRQTILRTDAGLGTDENINWALSHDYQVLMKGFNGKRAKAFASRIPAAAWHPVGVGRAVAIVPNAPRYARRTQTLLLRWTNPSAQTGYATLVHSLLDREWVTIPALFDGRGAMESEIKADKGGLLMPKRRKKRLAAQEALILLTDVAHNLLAWSHDWMLGESRFRLLGPYALVNDLLCIPGRVRFKGDKLQMVALRDTHPYAADMRLCLVQLLEHFGNP
jgi:Transposase DDE domain group 1